MSVANIPGHLHRFLLLDRDQQAQAVRRLASLGWNDSSIAAATGLAADQIRRILAEPHSTASENNPC